MTAGHKGRVYALAGGVAAIAVVTLASFVVPETVSARIIATTSAVSVVSPKVATNPSVSGDGHFVVFTAAPSTPDGRTDSVWLTDRTNGFSAELTNAKSGIRLGNSVSPVISADGCVVVITTEMAFDLFRDDDRGNRWDVYRTTLGWCGGKPNDWQLVSADSTSDGQGRARGDVDPTQQPAVSSSGSVVAYARPFRSLSGHDDPLHRPSAINVVDLSIVTGEPGHTTQVAGLPAESATNATQYRGQRGPALSGDGRFVIFSSDALSNDAVPEWAEPTGTPLTAASQIFAWDRTNPDPFTAVKLVSKGAKGAANASAVTPTVSADGRLVAFASSATNLVDSPTLSNCVSTCPSQIYVVDRDADANFIFDEPDSTITTPASDTAPEVTKNVIGTTIRLVSRVRAAETEPIIAADGVSSAPTMSADGNTIGFSTHASNLLAVRTPGGGELTDGDLLVADLGTQNLRRAFESPAPAPGAHAHPRLSANGRVLVADSLAADRLLGDPTIVGRHIVAVAFAPSLSVAEADLGTVTVGVPGPEWYVNVVNDGPGAFVPDTIESDNTDFAVSGGSCLDRSAVPAGKSCSVNIMLTPSRVGALTGTLTVAEAGFGAITLTTSLKGAGGDPALEATPAGADFLRTLVGQQSAPATINITSVYIEPTAVRLVKIAGQNPQDFSIDENLCHAQTVTVDGCPIIVSFTPTAAGRRTATVNVGIAAGQYTSIFLSGEGYYDASIVITADHARAGQRIGIAGKGFPASVGVLIGWSDGSGRGTMAITDGNGGFITQMLIVKGDRPGPRTLVAQVVNGPVASAGIEIERLTATGPGSPTWPRP